LDLIPFYSDLVQHWAYYKLLRENTIRYQ